jgi:hypothetical protein
VEYFMSSLALDLLSPPPLPPSLPPSLPPPPRYYELEVEYFMSSLALDLLSTLTKNYLWMTPLTTTPQLESEVGREGGRGGREGGAGGRDL